MKGVRAAGVGGGSSLRGNPEDETSVDNSSIYRANSLFVFVFDFCF